jgi:hypothetical protein
MHDPMLMCIFECVGNLLRDREDFVKRNCAGLDAVGESCSFHQLHYQCVSIAGIFFETVDYRDIGVTERCEDLCFATEPRHPLSVRGKCFRENL